MTEVYLILIGLLLVIAGASNAVMDVLKFRYQDSVFSRLNNQNWWDEFSWRNKYKDRIPERGERFPGSTTIFVFVTDGWHFFQMIWRTSMTLAIIFGVFSTLNFSMWLFFSIFIVSSCLYLGAFNLFYKKLLRL